MNFNDYQELAERTARQSHGTTDERFANFGMGLSGEAGEVTDYLKKIVFHGHEFDPEKLEKELGDVLWYVAAIATTAGLSLEEIAVLNIEKLRKRYPSGFSSVDSIKRVDEV